ncbi:MAG: PD-(D/E)XK nuclease superfamily protein [Acidobacteriota bacterium]
MAPRDTRTGSVLEEMILPALSRGGYTFRSRVKVGQRFGGGAHYVDVVAEKLGEKILVSLKWQQVPGTAEQKVPFEVICLAEALEQRQYSRAYLVLGGEGWKLRDFYTAGGLGKYINKIDLTRIVTLEAFIAKANQSSL